MKDIIKRARNRIEEENRSKQSRYGESSNFRIPQNHRKRYSNKLNNYKEGSNL